MKTSECSINDFKDKLIIKIVLKLCPHIATLNKSILFDKNKSQIQQRSSVLDRWICSQMSFVHKSHLTSKSVKYSLISAARMWNFYCFSPFYVIANGISLYYDLFLAKTSHLNMSPEATGSRNEHFSNIFCPFIDKTVNQIIIKTN